MRAALDIPNDSGKPNVLGGVIWNQGETDVIISDATAAAYSGELTALINQFRSDIAATNADQIVGGDANEIPWVLGEGTRWLDTQSPTRVANVYGAQESIAQSDEYIEYVSLKYEADGITYTETNFTDSDGDGRTFGVGSPDNIHFSTGALRGLVSERYANALRCILRIPKFYKTEKPLTNVSTGGGSVADLTPFVINTSVDDVDIDLVNGINQRIISTAANVNIDRPFSGNAGESGAIWVEKAAGVPLNLTNGDFGYFNAAVQYQATGTEVGDIRVRFSTFDTNVGTMMVDAVNVTRNGLNLPLVNGSFEDDAFTPSDGSGLYNVLVTPTGWTKITGGASNFAIGWTHPTFDTLFGMTNTDGDHGMWLTSEFDPGFETGITQTIAGEGFGAGDTIRADFLTGMTNNQTADGVIRAHIESDNGGVITTLETQEITVSINGWRIVGEQVLADATPAERVLLRWNTYDGVTYDVSIHAEA